MQYTKEINTSTPQTQNVRFAYHKKSFGGTPSGSLRGLWTIWEQRITWLNGHWAMVDNPYPVQNNLSSNDLANYGGELFDVYSLYRNGVLDVVFPTTCPHCGRIRVAVPEAEPCCLECGMADIQHQIKKEEEKPMTILDEYCFMDLQELQEECRIFAAQRDDNLKRLILLRLSIYDLRDLGYTDAEVMEAREELVLLNNQDDIPIGGLK